MSYATAWRIINNRPCSSEKAVRDVHRAVRQIGYEPAVGKQRRGRPTKVIDGIRTRNVALLHLRSGTSLSTAVLNAVHRMLAERDLNLVFAQVEDPSALPQAVRTGNVDGILGYGKFPDEAITQVIERIPSVWMMSRNDRRLDPFGDRVAPDHRAIGQLSAEYLLGMNLPKVAVLNPFPKTEIYRQRCESFTAAAKDGGMVVDSFEGRGENMQTEVARLADQWLATRGGPARGLFVPADDVALPLQRYLRHKGVTFDADQELILVSSDNDNELLRKMNPRPVTMDLSHEAIAQLAVERLFWRMRHGTSVPQTTLYVRPRLILSDSELSLETADEMTAAV